MRGWFAEALKGDCYAFEARRFSPLCSQTATDRRTQPHESPRLSRCREDFCDPCLSEKGLGDGEAHADTAGGYGEGTFGGRPTGFRSLGKKRLHECFSAKGWKETRA